MKIEKIYYWFVSSVSLIVFSIVIWNLLTNLLEFFMISNEEYLTRYDWRIEQCKTQLKKNNQSYEECIKNQKKKISLERKYELKQSIIWSLWYGFTSFLIFVFHYLRFKKIKE